MAMEQHEARIKRMTMRSWRRGTKEMDLILGPYAEAYLAQMQDAELDVYDQLLAENDQDLYAMILGQQTCPPEIAALLAKIGQFARDRWSKG
jgi:antitoxin CptB